ncbi:MAG: hypothetical protein KatS3mg109_0276 [Pirellulaceae bacterium]|nr:MAG: hypothetical protein KatS3mg109_0276 [Pirellulaceae bacterium]
MRITLYLLSALALFTGVGILINAQSAVHEIEAFVVFLISAVYLVGASVIGAINSARKRIESSIREASPSDNSTRMASNPVTSATAATEPPLGAPVEKTIGFNEFSAWNSEHDEEEQASTLLAQARQFAKTGEREMAISALHEVIRCYPRTSAAEKARRSLKKSGITS